MRQGAAFGRHAEKSHFLEICPAAGACNLLAPDCNLVGDDSRCVHLYVEDDLAIDLQHSVAGCGATFHPVHPVHHTGPYHGHSSCCRFAGRHEEIAERCHR